MDRLVGQVSAQTLYAIFRSEAGVVPATRLHTTVQILVSVIALAMVLLLSLVL